MTEKKKKKSTYSYASPASLVFFIDYLPLLTRKKPAAAILYLIYQRCQDKKTGMVEIQYQDYYEQFGYDKATIDSINKALVHFDLISVTKSDAIHIEIELLDPKPLDEIRRMKAYAKVGVKSNTAFRIAYANRAKSTYRSLLKSAVDEDIRETAAYEDKYKEAMSLGVVQWKAMHFLAYFMTRYEQRYGCKYTFMNEKAMWHGKEIKDLKIVIQRFKGNTEEARHYIDWVFDIKSYDKHLNGLDRTGLLYHNSMLQEYRRAKVKAGGHPVGTKPTSLLPTSFQQWVHKQFVDFNYPIETYQDLTYVLSAAQVMGKEDPNLVAVIEEASKQGLVTIKE